MHARKVCDVHGGVVSQCRCPAPQKTTIRVPCDERCRDYQTTPEGQVSDDEH
jgi:hypothetical protein